MGESEVEIMSLLFIDEFTAIDYKDIDVIEPQVYADKVESVLIWTKNGKYLKLSFEQYRKFVESYSNLFKRGSTKEDGWG